MIFDAIKRFLTYSGYEVKWVVNITDVDDKLIHEANRRGIAMSQVATENTADYLANLQVAGRRPDRRDAEGHGTHRRDHGSSCRT